MRRARRLRPFVWDWIRSSDLNRHTIEQQCYLSQAEAASDILSVDIACMNEERNEFNALLYEGDCNRMGFSHFKA